MLTSQPVVDLKHYQASQRRLASPFLFSGMRIRYSVTPVRGHLDVDL
jgi:hypothetical protein